MYKKILKKIITFSGIILFIYIIYNIGIEKVVSAIFVLKPEYLLIFPLIEIPHALLYCYLWYIIIKKDKLDIDYFSIFKISLISSYYALITSEGGGHLLRIEYLKKKSGKTLQKFTTNMIVTESIQIISLIIIAAIGVIFLIQYFTNIFLALTVALIIAAGSYLIFKNKKILKKIIDIVMKNLIPKEYHEKMYVSTESILEYFLRGKILILPTIVGLAFWIVYASEGFIVGKMLLIDMPYFYFILMFLLADAFIVLTLSFSITYLGLGVQEVFFLAFFSIFSIEAAKIVAFSIIYYVFISRIIPATIGGILILFDRKLEKKATKLI